MPLTQYDILPPAAERTASLTGCPPGGPAPHTASSFPSAISSRYRCLTQLVGQDGLTGFGPSELAAADSCFTAGAAAAAFAAAVPHCAWLEPPGLLAESATMPCAATTTATVSINQPRSVRFSCTAALATAGASRRTLYDNPLAALLPPAYMQYTGAEPKPSYSIRHLSGAAAAVCADAVGGGFRRMSMPTPRRSHSRDAAANPHSGVMLSGLITSAAAALAASGGFAVGGPLDGSIGSSSRLHGGQFHVGGLPAVTCSSHARQRAGRGALLPSHTESGDAGGGGGAAAATDNVYDINFRRGVDIWRPRTSLLKQRVTALTAAAGSGGGSDGDGGGGGSGGRNPKAHVGGGRTAANTADATTEAAAAAAAATADALRKSLLFQPLSLQPPHHRAFHLAWAGGCVSYMVAFAPAALLPEIRDDLQLPLSAASGAAVCALIAPVVTLFAAGLLAYHYGPRYCQVMFLLVAAPLLACTALVTSSGGFIWARFLLGTSLGIATVTQAWMVAMFDYSVLGTAAAAAAGLSDAGGGLVSMLLPLLYGGLRRLYDGNVGAAWRASFQCLAALCLVVAVLTLMYGQDTPSGDFLDPKPHPGLSWQLSYRFRGTDPAVAAHKYRRPAHPHPPPSRQQAGSLSDVIVAGGSTVAGESPAVGARDDVSCRQYGEIVECVSELLQLQSQAPVLISAPQLPNPAGALHSDVGRSSPPGVCWEPPLASFLCNPMPLPEHRTAQLPASPRALAAIATTATTAATAAATAAAGAGLAAAAPVKAHPGGRGSAAVLPFAFHQACTTGPPTGSQGVVAEAGLHLGATAAAGVPAVAGLAVAAEGADVEAPMLLALPPPSPSGRLAAALEAVSCSHGGSDGGGNRSRRRSSDGGSSGRVEEHVRLYGLVLRNPICWILALNYGLAFGSQLVAFNTLPLYLHDNFGVGMWRGGCVAGAFGLLNVVTRGSGHRLSAAASRRRGMRGRLWLLWVLQTAGGAFCALLGYVGRDSLAATVVLLLLFAVTVQQACGVAFSITPFVSYRGFSAVTATVAVGGHVGAAVLQGAFFDRKGMPYSRGFQLMGVSCAVASTSLLLLRFPPWGGMTAGAANAAAEDEWAEERYYAREWTPAERDQGLAGVAAGFAWLSKSERLGGRPQETVEDPAAAEEPPQSTAAGAVTPAAASA